LLESTSSIRDPETGMPYETITADDGVVMNGYFEIVEGHRKPSIEFNFHIAIMNAVIHTQPLYSSVFGVIREVLTGIGENFVQIAGEKIINCEYALPGPPEPAKNVVSGLGTERNAVMMPNHDTICVGADFDTAMKVIHVVEKTAQVYIMARSIETPHLISDEDIKVRIGQVILQYPSPSFPAGL